MRDTRYPELDALRGIAVIMMVAYHLAFDLAYFYNWQLNVTEGWWLLFVYGTASLFLLLIGICFMISWQRTNKEGRWRKYIRRSIIIFSGGMLISLATWLTADDTFVRFGILHLIGVSAILQPFFAERKNNNFFIGFGIVILGWIFMAKTTSSSFLFPLGLTTDNFVSFDYYPLFPWFGVILIGMAVGNILYLPTPKTYLSKIQKLPYPPALLWTGRRSLILYFLHQPVILLVLHLTSS